MDGGILLAMSEQVAEVIRDAIRDHGPITFAEFMQHALYGPGGFYEDPPVGTHGDFVTSPHVHPVFGALVMYHSHADLASQNQSLEFSALVLIMLVFFACFGAGEWSVDQRRRSHD